MMGESAHVAKNLLDAWSELRDCEQYLLFQDTDGEVAYLSLDEATRAVYPSQYFRRRLGERFGVDRPWDWRAYDRPEPWLQETVAQLAQADVPVCR
jgi:hypothetical protein